MKTPSEIACFIEALPDRQKSGTLRIWGQWFGKPMDNVHTCTSCRADDDLVVLTFNEGEELSIWKATGVLVESQATLTFPSAAKVRWDWYFYGRPRMPENRMFIEYVVNNDEIQRSSNTSDVALDKARLHEPAVQICGM